MPGFGIMFESKKKSKSKDDMGGGGGGLGMSEDSLALVDDLFDAMESKDRDAGAMALRAFFHNMQGEEEAEPKEEESDETPDEEEEEDDLY